MDAMVTDELIREPALFLDGQGTRWKRGDIHYAAWAQEIFKAPSRMIYLGWIERSGRGRKQVQRRPCPHEHPTSAEAVACAEGMIVDVEMEGWEGD